MTKETRVTKGSLGDIVNDWAVNRSWSADDDLFELVESSNFFFDDVIIEDVIIGDEKNSQCEFSFNGSLYGSPIDGGPSWSGDIIHFSVEGVLEYGNDGEGWKVLFASVTSSGVADADVVKQRISERADIFLLNYSYPPECRSVDELLKEISEFGDKYWWRGHGNKGWLLTPGIARHSKRSFSLETELRLEFENQSMFLVSPSSQLAIAKVNFLMQHHGLPTRLLDWSTSPLVALYFAVIDEKDTNDACLWMLDPRRLNNIGREPFPYISSDGNEELFAEGYDKILAIHAPYVDLRMKMQQSEFTVHGHYRALDVEDGVNLFLKKRITIRHELKAEIRERLKVLGVTRASLFPDMDSIAKFIKNDVLK